MNIQAIYQALISNERTRHALQSFVPDFKMDYLSAPFKPMTAKKAWEKINLEQVLESIVLSLQRNGASIKSVQISEPLMINTAILNDWQFSATGEPIPPESCFDELCCLSILCENYQRFTLFYTVDESLVLVPIGMNGEAMQEKIYTAKPLYYLLNNANLTPFMTAFQRSENYFAENISVMCQIAQKNAQAHADNRAEEMGIYLLGYEKIKGDKRLGDYYPYVHKHLIASRFTAYNPQQFTHKAKAEQLEKAIIEAESVFKSLTEQEQEAEQERQKESELNAFLERLAKWNKLKSEINDLIAQQQKELTAKKAEVKQKMIALGTSGDFYEPPKMSDELNAYYLKKRGVD